MRKLVTNTRPKRNMDTKASLEMALGKKKKKVLILFALLVSTFELVNTTSWVISFFRDYRKMGYF